MINFDFHIHSVASQYKEGLGIVDNSTVENASVLLTKLNEYNVGLFSITDHNRFNAALYQRLDELLLTGEYPEVKGLVAGIEFDVQMDPTMGKCHIITIFDAANQNINYRKIEAAVNEQLLTDADQAYTKADFESLLKTIGLDVILIACQRNSLERHEGHHNSLSESTMGAEGLIQSGYINALEFQRPNVEGILRDNLKEIPSSVGLVMGSDCHDWSAYPYHDPTNRNLQFHHSRAKILPTFKGLLMAFTSPETRINTQENTNPDYIHSFFVNGREMQLVNGINAIIGENGSGKSTLVKMLNGDSRESFVKKIIDENDMSPGQIDASKRLYIGQGDIVKKFDKGELITESNYIPVDTTAFVNMYKKFARDILKYIQQRIKVRQASNALMQSSLEYDEIVNEVNYFIVTECEDDYSEVVDQHTSPDHDLGDIIRQVESLIENDYFDEFEASLTQVIELLKNIHSTIHDRHIKKQVEQQIKNYIVSFVAEYDRKVSEASNSRENDKRSFLSKRRLFIDGILKAVKENSKDNTFPELPTVITGFSTRPTQGFNFNAETEYHNRDVLQDFLTRMFNRDYASVESLNQIETEEDLVLAIKSCTNSSQIENKYQTNLNSFLEDMCRCRRYIVDTSADNNELGNTLGELSLAYFKYLSQYEKGKSVIIIDQPEDHISNNNVSKKLISYFNGIRNKKQVIIVTHNPLLVVNLDVDKVFFIKKENARIGIVEGCLEYEDENVNILNLIATNMDGGKDSIEKRLRIYGKENYS